MSVSHRFASAPSKVAKQSDGDHHSPPHALKVRPTSRNSSPLHEPTNYAGLPRRSLDDSDEFWLARQFPDSSYSLENARHDAGRTNPAKQYPPVSNSFRPDERLPVHMADCYRPTQEVARHGEASQRSPPHQRPDRGPSASFPYDFRRTSEDSIRVNTSPRMARAQATPKSKRPRSLSTTQKKTPVSHQRKVEYKGLRDVPVGPKSQPHAEPGRLQPVDRHILAQPHVFISGDHLPPALKQVYHVRGWARPYSALDVHVDNRGYYITFENNSQGHLNLERCCRTNQRLFGNPAIQPEEFHFGQVPTNEPNIPAVAPQAFPPASPSEYSPASPNFYSPTNPEDSTQHHEAPPSSNMDDAVPAYDDEQEHSSDNIVVSNHGPDQANSSDLEAAPLEVSKPKTPVADTNRTTPRPADSGNVNASAVDAPPPSLHPSAAEYFQSRPSSSSEKTVTSDSVTSTRCFVCKESRETQRLYRCSTCPRKWHRPCVPGSKKPSQREMEKPSWQCPNCIKKGRPPKRKEPFRDIHSFQPKTAPPSVPGLPIAAPSKRDRLPSETSTEQLQQRRGSESMSSFTAISALRSAANIAPLDVAQDLSTSARPFVDQYVDTLTSSTGHSPHHRALNVVQRELERRNSVEPPKPLQHTDNQCQPKELQQQTGRPFESPQIGGSYKKEPHWLEEMGIGRFRPTVHEDGPPAPPDSLNQRLPSFEGVRETSEHNESDAAHQLNGIDPPATATTDASIQPPLAASPALTKDSANDEFRPTSSAGARPTAFKARRTKTKLPTIIECRNCKSKAEQDAEKSHLCIACKSRRNSLIHVANTKPAPSVAVPSHNKSEEQSSTVLQLGLEVAAQPSEHSGRELSASSEPLTSLPTEDTSKTPQDTSLTDGMFSGPTSHSEKMLSSKEVDTTADIAQPKDFSTPLQTPTKINKPRAKDGELGDSVTKKRRVMRIGGENLGDSFQRPKGTYEKLIGFSMQDAPGNRMQARGVCNWIAKNVTSYKMGIDGWESGIGATLSIHEGTRGKQLWSKVEWRDGEPDEFGKGCWYTLNAGVAHKMIKWDPIAKQPIGLPTSTEKRSEGPTKSKSSKRAAEGGSLPSPSGKKVKRDRSKATLPEVHADAMDIDLGPLAGVTTEKSLPADVQTHKLDRAPLPAKEQDLGPFRDATMGLSEWDIDELAGDDQQTRVVASPPPKLHRTTLPKAPPAMPLHLKPDIRTASELVKDEVVKVEFTSKDLFADWPQYDPDQTFDEEAKLAEIKRRPTRKQMIGKGPIHSRLGDHIAKASWEELCRSSNEKRDGIGLSERHSKRGTTSFRPEDSVRAFTNVREFLGMPNDPLPILKNGQVVYRDGTKDEFGQLTRTRDTYKTGL